MAETKTCSRCGTTLAEGEEQCPRCLLELGRSTPEPSSPGASAPGPRARRRAAPPLEEIARRFPELEVLGFIGEGGMGAVYRARQTRIERPVALKVLSLDPGDDPTFAERFRREAMVLARLDHKNVVKLYDFGERDGLYFLILELVDGSNLRTLMKQGLLAPAQALAIVPQICEALQFAHDEGVVHRDIKPENVLIDSKGRVKIADFGLAKLVDADTREVSLTEVDQVLGTPHYMAPEQLRGSRNVDHRADIYSLGVVLYEMLTGELPRGNFELPSKRVQVDVRLDEIVLKSLERTPERRYQHAVEVKTDVENVGSGRGGSHLESSLDSIPERAEAAALADVADRREHGVKVGYGTGVIHPNKPWEFFLTFLLLWPLAGLAFNGGAWWFTGAMALIAAAFWSQVEHSIHARPELAAALKAEKHGVRAARHLAALALLPLGLFTLFAAHVSLFEHLDSDYRSGPSDPALMRALNTQLLPMLDARLHLGWPAPSRKFGFQVEGIWMLDRSRTWNMRYLAFLAPILIGGAAFALSAKRAKPGSSLGWRTTALATISLLGSLLLLEGFCTWLATTRVEGGPLVPVLDRELASPSAPASVHGADDLSRRLRLALVQQNYDVAATGVWSVDERTTPGGPEQLQIHFAEPASPFDRWRMSWYGPRRIRPHAVFMLNGPRDDGAVTLHCDLGDVRPESAERHEWSDWLGGVLAATR